MTRGRTENFFSSRIAPRGDVANTFVCNMAYDCNGTPGGLFFAGGMNCIVQNAQAVNAGYPYIWSTYRNAPTKIARDRRDAHRHVFITPDYFNQIVNCRLIGGEGVVVRARKYGHDSRDDMDGLVQLGTLVAYNDILGHRQRGVGPSQRDSLRAGVLVDGPIHMAAVENNTIAGCDAAVVVSKGAAHTHVRRNRMVRIERTPVLDEGAGTIVGRYVDKARFHDHWPQGFNVLQLSAPASPFRSEGTK